MVTDSLAMEQALQEARLALTNETIPVGSVLIGPDGEVIGRGRNRTYSAGDCSGHAEIEAIRDAGSLLLRPAYFQRCTLYTTAEPCMMCTGAISAAGVIRVVWGANGSIGCFSSLAQNAAFQSLFSALRHSQISDPDLVQACEKLMQIWHERQEEFSARWS